MRQPALGVRQRCAISHSVLKETFGYDARQMLQGYDRGRAMFPPASVGLHPCDTV
jgi:hypothetical protein